MGEEGGFVVEGGVGGVELKVRGGEGVVEGEGLVAC